jgi:hypothetical protein
VKDLNIYIYTKYKLLVIKIEMAEEEKKEEIGGDIAIVDTMKYQ